MERVPQSHDDYAREVLPYLKEGRDFWIPAEILHHPALTWSERMLLAFIEYTGGNEEGCEVPHHVLALSIDLERETLTKSLKRLMELGLLKTGRWGEYLLIDYPARPGDSAAEMRAAVQASEAARRAAIQAAEEWE